MKSRFFARILCTLSLCFFALSCQKDITLETDVAPQVESPSLMSASQNQGATQNVPVEQIAMPYPPDPYVVLMYATVVARRGGINMPPKYDAVFTANEKAKVICYDSQRRYYFAVNFSPSTSVVVGRKCPSCLKNNIVIETPSLNPTSSCDTCMPSGLTEWVTALIQR